MEKLSKNFIWMAASNIVSSLFGAIVFIYLARILEPSAFGYLSYAFTIVFFLANFIDLGLSTYGTREISKDRKRISDYVSEIVSFRLLVSAFLCLVLIIFTLLWPHNTTLKAIIICSSFMLLTIGLSSEWAFQGVEKMHMVFVSSSVTSFMQLALIYLLIKGPSDLLKAPILYFIATLPIIIIFLKRLKFKFSLKEGDLKSISVYLSSALIIWSISIFAQVYNGMDIFILGMFRPMGEVGCFTVARRIIGSFAMLMIFLANAALPRLSLDFCEDIAKFRETTKKFLKLVIALTILALIPCIFLSKNIISLVLGSEYVAASMPLNIMIVGLILVLFNLPYSTGLIACGAEKEILKQTIASAALSVFLNFILIPRYGMIGASISFLCAEALALLWVLRVYEKRVQARGAQIKREE